METPADHQPNTTPSDLPALLAALRQPSAYPVAVAGPIALVQTHASAVLLAGEYAYKLKKPRDFGFFDYSTPERRRHFCALEVELNRRMARDIYLGVAPVVRWADGRVAFAPTCPPEAVPAPGAAFAGGRVSDYAVVMRRLPEEATLAAHVRAGSATAERLAAIGRFIAAFHAGARADAAVARFGELATIRANWEENFEQMRPYVGRALTSDEYERIAAYVRAFLERRAPLFATRVAAGRIRDCHGDLRLQHVYLFADAPTPAEEIAVVDCIEFNDRFRYSDVAAEVAFLAMELDAAGRADLSRAFVEGYVAAADDAMLRELLPFYLCYRACVRGKVTAFQLDQPELGEAQRERARRDAAELFALAASYAEERTRPALVLLGGLMGSGKTTLATALSHETGWALVSSDATRKALAGIAPTHPEAAAYGAGLYSAEWNARTYATLGERARAALAAGRSVVLDASFSRRAERRALAALARELAAEAIFVEAICPETETLRRLAARWRARTSDTPTPAADLPEASDGRPELYQRQRAAWEPYDTASEPELRHLALSTEPPRAQALAQLLAALGVPARACWPEG